jgi:hypothetical protein
MKEPLKVYFDGKLVGEVPDTGDRQTNLKAMSALITSSGAGAPLTRSQAAFRQASAFAINAQHLFNTGLVGAPPSNPMNVIPFAVNAAFAIELYFKTLGFIHGRKLHGHNLLSLLNELPAEAKDLLRLEIARSLATEGIKDFDGFRTEVARLRHVFKEWRYLHERDSAPEIRFLEFIHVLNILHNICRTNDQIRPATIGDAAGTTVTGVARA